MQRLAMSVARARSGEMCSYAHSLDDQAMTGWRMDETSQSDLAMSPAYGSRCDSTSMMVM